MRKAEKRCTSCGDSMSDEDVTHHSGKDYCPECMAEHLKNEHSVPLAGRTTEERRAWTYKSH